MNAPANIEAATLASAMAAAFAEIEGATKSVTGQVGQQKYKYADLTAVIEAIKPALINNGLFFTQHPEPNEKGICIETVLHHANGDLYSMGKLFVPANKNDAQGFGSALTYARRYALVTAFGVPVEDDDGNAVAKGQQAKQEAPVVDKISRDQLTELELLIPAAKLTPAQFNQTFGINRVSDLPANKFDDAKTRLNERLAELAKRETNEKATENA